MARTFFVSLLLVFALFSYVSRASVIDNEVYSYDDDEECNLPEGLREEIQGYQPMVNLIIDTIINGRFAGDTYQSLMAMTDKFGPRLSGSQALEDTIDYMVEEFNKAGLENVHTEPAMVPHWVRGYEYAELLTPRQAKLEILGLGFSVATPRGGITAETIVVESFDEFDAIPVEEVIGKIVVFVPAWVGYGATNQYRSRGATVASQKGAIGVLIRSMTPFSIGTPHTGALTYTNTSRQIPAASITVEDAMVLLRLYRKGEKLTVRLEMQNKNLPMVLSGNTIGELLGTNDPKKSVVVVSGHLDSWDVGVGAMDDGGGCFISWKAVQYLKEMGLRPKRTIRAILWTAEEVGLNGAYAYQQQHAATEEEEFNVLMESDIGTFAPLGMDFSGTPEAACIFKEIIGLMSPLNATQFKTPGGGPDLSPWSSRGFPAASLLNQNERYFWFHHTHGDSMLVQDPSDMDKGTAMFAATAYVLADLSVDIPKTVLVPDPESN